jgi:hypothetical protein
VLGSGVSGVDTGGAVTVPAHAAARTLAAHEEVIERAITRAYESFVVIGTELDAIRKDRSYRVAHPTFDAYCQDRWGFTASRARQLIRAAKSVTSGNASGATEREVRRMLAGEPQQKAQLPPPPQTIKIPAAIEEAVARLEEIDREMEAIRLWQDVILHDLRDESFDTERRREAAINLLRPLVETGAFDPRGKIYEQTLGARDRGARKLAVLDLQLEILDWAEKARRDYEAAMKREEWEKTATPEQIAKRDEREAQNRARKEQK